MDRIVLDASAVLAMTQEEPGGERVETLLEALQAGSDVEVSICSVNWCEVLTRAQREFQGMTAADLRASLAGVELVPFGEAEAEHAADYARVSQALSLGDRACLALARRLRASVWTTERLWTKCPLDVQVELIRP